MRLHAASGSLPRLRPGYDWGHGRAGRTKARDPHDDHGNGEYCHPDRGCGLPPVCVERDGLWNNLPTDGDTGAYFRNLRNRIRRQVDQFLEQLKHLQASSRHSLTPLGNWRGFCLRWYDRCMGTSLHYCHICHRETAAKRYEFSWAWFVNWFSGWLMLATNYHLDAYERNRPMRCGVCGTTYSLIDNP